MRQIAPQEFAPVYSDPHAPAHKPPAAQAAAAPARPRAQAVPSREKPYGACAPEAAGFVGCLPEAATLSDRDVEAAERAALAGFAHRPDLNPVLADAAAKALRAADEAWRALRERECGELALIENGLTGALYARRLECRIRRDVERAAFLRERYGAR